MSHVSKGELTRQIEPISHNILSMTGVSDIDFFGFGGSWSVDALSSQQTVFTLQDLKDLLLTSEHSFRALVSAMSRWVSAVLAEKLGLTQY